MTNMIMKELDNRNMGVGSFNASCIIQTIQKSTNSLKQCLIQHLGKPTANRNTDFSQRIINQTVLHPG